MLRSFPLFLQDLLRVQVGLLPVVVPRLGAADVVDLVVELLRLHVMGRLLVLVQPLWNDAPAQNVKASLGLGQGLPLGGLLKTYVPGDTLF